MTIRHRLLHYFTTTALLSASLTGAAIISAPAASATGCPTGFSPVSSTICEQSFTSTGRSIWTVPDGVTSIDVLVVGGGGGGSQGGSSNGDSAGSGGGGGGIEIQTGVSVSPQSSYEIYVGTGGLGSVFYNDGTASTFGVINNNGSYIARGGGGSRGITELRRWKRGTGGAGGDGGSSTPGGVGYTGASGGAGNYAVYTIDGPPGAGGNGRTVWGRNLAGGGGGGTRWANGFPPGGGATSFGGGDGGAYYSLGADGAVNTGGGGGGGGGGFKNGGSGGSGLVVIRTAPSVAAPAAPTLDSVNPGDGSVTVAFTPGSDGGATISNYDYSVDGGSNWTTLSPASTASPIVLTGLTNGTTYQVQIRARNSVGAGAPTSSVSVTPVATAPAITFSTPVRAADGFTVNVTNHDPDFVWAISPSAGAVTQGAVVGSTLPLTVTGLSAGASATLTVTTTRSGYANRSATVTGQAKSEQVVTWSPVTAISTASSTTTPSSLASGPVGGGSISYSVDSFTTTACSVDSSTAVMTVSGTGDCVVRATAEATANYLEGSAVVTFSLSKAAQPVTWAPSTSLTLPGATVSPATASVPAGGGTITYSVEDDGSTGCSVNPSTGALTYTGAGECVVRATAEATTAYVQGHTDITFAISKATPTLTWNPDLVQVLPNTSTTFAAATTSSDGAITYAVTDAGATSCSLPNDTSTVLSFSADGSCEVTVTVAGTTDYDEVKSVKTFAIYKSSQTITWSPSTSLDLASVSTDVGGASTSGDGAVSYSVTSAGGTGCAFADSSSPTLTYSAAGTCTVTATAASTVAYAQATESVIIRITKATPTMTWSPTTALVMPAATVSPSSSPSTTSDGTLSYAVVSDTGTNCTVNSSTGALAYTDTGICQVSASTTSTTRYAAASTTVDFTVSLAPQTITAAASSTSLRPRGTTTVSSGGNSGSGAVTWTNTTPAICTLTGTTVTADTNGSCVLTVSIEPDATYAAASDSITIAVTTPPPPAGGGGSGGSGGGSGGPSGGGSSGSGGGSSSTASSGGSGSGSGGGSGGSGDAAQSQDDVAVPGTGSTTRGRSLPPPPQEVDVQPLRSGARSSVLIKQPVGTAGAQVLATVVVVRNAKGKIISRINIELEPGQTQTRVTVPYVADGYTVDVYNVNEVGVSTGALTRSPLVRATTITKRTSSGQPRLFGEMLGKPIIFNGGSAALDKSDKKQLRAIARQAKASNERLFVTGFTRKGGGSASELASLSTKRARAAATYLSKQGVRVWIRYWGAGSLNGTGAKTDRRVEVRSSAAPIPRTLVP